jgi:hypothetical protein
MTAGCLRIAAGKRMSVEEEEEEAVKYCKTADADCCDAASYSSSSNSSYYQSPGRRPDSPQIPSSA